MDIVMSFRPNLMNPFCFFLVDTKPQGNAPRPSMYLRDVNFVLHDR